MKVLVRNSTTGLYLTAASEWSEQESAARHFNSGVEALEFCFQHHYFESVFELKFDDLGETFRLRPFRGWRRLGHFGQVPPAI